MRKGVLFGILVALSLGAAAAVPPHVVETVDLVSYMGLWYSIASIPTSFERRCVQGTTAEYFLLDDGTIEVVNSCYEADGSWNVTRGHAWIPDLAQPGKLRVSFVRFLGRWWFGAPYWVVDLAADYSYAAVGHPDRTYGWILSRTPTLPDDVLEGIFERLEAQGYRREDFRRIDQSIHLIQESVPETPTG